MKSRHKKFLISGVAIAVAAVLGAGALFENSVSVQASAAMMPGIETIIKNSTEKKPFRILELVDTSEDAEIGYYVSGQEPGIRLYEYSYQDENNDTKTVHFASLEEGLSKLPPKQRKEFAMNVKLNEDGSVNEDASTGIRKIRDIAGTDGEEDSPLSYSDYQEKYFLSDGESEEEWKKLELKNFDGTARTDTVSLTGTYEKSDSGDYTKQQQEYYPIRKDVEGDAVHPEKYRENIQDFYFSEGEDVRGAYHVTFEEVENDVVNQALTDESDRGQKTILPEYDYSNGKYGYYENVYTDLTAEIAEDIASGNYSFPGENPEDVSGSEDAVLIQDNSSTQVEEPDSEFDDGTIKTGSGSETSQDFQTGEEESDVDDFSGEENFGSGEDGELSDETAAAQDTVGDLEIQDAKEPGTDQDDATGEGDFSGEDPAEDPTENAKGQTESEDFAEDSTQEDQNTENSTESRILGELKTPEAAGSQADPYVYLGENIAQYPFYKYTLIGDLEYIKEQAEESQAKDQALTEQGQEVVRNEGDITLADDQYWYWEKDENGNLVRGAISIVTGKQPVAYSDIQKIPEDFAYNYYYKVEKVWFCCRKSDGGNENDPSAYTNFGWYYPSYPENEDTYLKVEDGDARPATHYISDAEYKLTPGSGDYRFVPGEGDTCLVDVDHFYYKGGYTNHDWMKRYVFHLSPGDEEFKDLNIQVDTRKASDFSDIYAAQSDTSTQSADLVLEDAPAADDETVSADGTEELFSDEAESTGQEAGSGDISDGSDSETFEDGSAESTSATTETFDTGILADYDLIYINGTLSDTTAAFFKDSTVPCIINASRLTDASVLQETFKAFIKDSDADGHYVNHYVYFFKNTLQEGRESSLVNTAFYTNFNPEGKDDSAGAENDPAEGFEEILSYIKSENQYRALGTPADDSEDTDDLTDGEKETLEPLSTELSQARALEYIINYQYKRHQSAKDKLKVLEIMPDANCSDLDRKDVIRWLKLSEEDTKVENPEIENVEACCSQNGHDADKMLDGRGDTWWNSDQNVMDHDGSPHYITVTLKTPSKVNGFFYQSRSDSANEEGNSFHNGVLSDYEAYLYDENGKLIGKDSDTSVVEWNGTGNKTKTVQFKKTYSDVKRIRIVFKNTYHMIHENMKGKIASCARLGLVYDRAEDRVDIQTMTASEFVGHIDDLTSAYDMIYISGKKNDNSDSLITGDGSYRYVHTGSGRQAQPSGTSELLKLLGQLDNEYDQTYSEDGKRRFAPFSTYGPESGGYFRGSGNDMTWQQCEELLDFVKSGYPVVVDSELLDSSGAVDSSKVDTASGYYRFISQALKYENVFNRKDLDDEKKDISFFSNLAKLVIQFDADDGKPAEASGVGEFSDGTEESGTIKDELKFTFTVENDSDADPAVSTYNCNLYIDLNFDGVFSEKEKQDKYITVQDHAGTVLTQVKYGEGDYRYELKMGETYTITRKIPSDYYKLITWKLEVENNRNPYIHTSETGYSKQENSTGQKQKIRVLQLIPKNCTWNLQTDGKFQSLLADVQDFDVEIETKNVSDLENYSREQMRQLLDDKQMLIIGFADVYQDIPNNHDQVEEILSFVKAGKSILFAHDTTSYINYDYNKIYGKIASTQYGVDENTNVYWDNHLHKDYINNVTWGLSLNTVLRSVTGMDRYGITSDKQLENGMTISQLLKQGNGLLDGSSVTFKELMEKAGDIAYKNGNTEESYAQTQGYTNNLLNQYMLGSDGTKTTRIKKINEGAITQYPYKMGDTLNIAETHGQYYQLGLEQDCDINGNSDGKTDIVVWYTLSGSIYDRSPNDARNNYYLYSKGNVIYTGAGHSNVTGDDEIKLFINAIVAAANVTAVQPEVNFVKTLNPSAEAEEVHYYMTDQSHWTAGENNTLETSADLNINVKDYNMVSADLNQEDLDNQEMTLRFYIEDENGTLLSDTETDTLPSDLGNQKLTDITAAIGSLTPYGNEGNPILCGADGKFHTTQNNAYALTIPEIETYLRQTETDGTQDYRKTCKVWVQVSSTVYLYGEPKTSTVWASVDLKQRQLFDLD